MCVFVVFIEGKELPKAYFPETNFHIYSVSFDEIRT